MGPRRVLLRVVLWWSFFTAATGWVRAGLAGRDAIPVRRRRGRLLSESHQGFHHLAAQRERVRAQGIMWMSARWGGAFTPLIVEWAIRRMTWRHAFEAFGVLGVLWAAAFYPWFRDNPRDHKGVNAEELAVLEGAEKLATGDGHVPWKKLIRSRTAWMLWAQYFCLSYSWYFYITWLPTYLKEYRHLDAGYAAQLAVFPLLFGGLGCAIGGFLSPLAARWTGSVAVARRWMAYVGFGGAGLMLLVHTGIRSPLWAMVVMGLAGFANDLVMPGPGGLHGRGRKVRRDASGSMNMMGNLGSGIAPIVFGYVIQTTKSCLPNFYIMAAIYLLGALCWRFIDPVTPLEET